MRSVWLALTAAVVAACQGIGPATPGPQDVMLTAAHGSGDVVILTLHNRSSGDIGYNLCASALERRSGSSWVPVPPVPDRVCTMELRRLAPGRTASYSSVYVTPLPHGEYRVTTNVETSGGTWGGASSNTFNVN